MAILRNDTTIRSADGQTTSPIITAANIGNYGISTTSTYYIGTTQNVFNRASGAQTLTGVSIDGNAANITAYTINQNVGTGNTPSFAGLVSSAVTNYAFLQVTDTNNFWITPGNNNWGLYFETSAGGLLGGTGDSNRLGFVGAGNARFYVDLNNGNGWFGASLTANTDSRAPIFYDSANTAYYLDPNNTGTSLNTAGAVVAGTYVYSTTYLQAGNNNIYPNGFANTLILNAGNSAGNSWITGISIAQGGNVGVGTSGPDTNLQVVGHIHVGNQTTFDNTGGWNKTIYLDGTVHARMRIIGSAFASGKNSQTETNIWVDNSVAPYSGLTTNAGSFTINAGFTTLTNSARSPIFYDNDDTNYYCDPNSVSRLSSLRVYSAFDTASSDVYANMRVMRNNATTDGMYIGYGNSGSGSALTRIFGGGATTGELSKYSTYTLEPGSFRSPIFYDSDNTAYYIDAASTSNLNVLVVAASARVGGAASRSTSGLTVGFTDNSTFAANTDVGDTDRMLSIVNESSTTNAMSVLGFRVNPNGGTANAMMDIKFVQTGVTNTSALHYTFNHGGTFADRFSILSSGNVGFGTTSPYGKIDLGSNTGAKLFIYGNGGNVGYITGLGTDISGSSALSFFTGTGRFEWVKGSGNYPYSSYTLQAILDASSNFIVTSSVRAPVFYDSDDTNYYVDPASTTNLLTLSVNRINNLRPYVDTWHTSTDGTRRFYFANGGTTYYSTANNYVFRNASDVGVVTIDGSGNLRTSTSGDNYASYSLHVGGTGFATADFRSPIFYDSNDTNYYADPASTSVFNRLKIDGGNFAFDYFQSLSDFTSGTLVTTDIPATAAEGESFVMNVVGKSYSASASPFNFTVQGYLYSSTIINFSGIKLDSTGLTSVKIFENGGVLCFWWPTISYWNAFEVSVRAYNNAKNNYNRVTNITNSTEPVGTKKVTVTLQSFLRADVSATNSVDLRAPIFYDSNDTTYYTDPSSLSNILELKTNKNWYDTSASVWGGGINMAGNSPSIGFQSTASTWWYMLHHSSSAINFYRRSTSGSWNQDGIWDSSGNFIWQGSSVRGQIFYDQNNTAYYIDAASGSNLNNVTVAGTLTLTNIAKNSTAPIVINSGQSASLGLRVYYDMNLYNTLTFTDSAWNSQGSIFGSSSVVTINAATATTSFVKYAGYSQEGGSFRAPIFYDSDNTSYYIDAAGTSSLNILNVASYIDVSTYIYLRNNLRMLNSGANGWLETIVRNSGSPYFQNSIDGGTFLASDTSENNNWLFQEAARGWGIFYFNRGTQSGQTFGSYTTIGAETFIIGQGTGTTMTSTWTGYNASSKVAIMLSNYSGYIWANDTIFSATGMRAPIFYDSDDTNFYANPAGESKFNYLRLTNNNALYFTTTGVAELNNEGNSTNVAFRMIKSGSSNSDGNNYGVLNLQRTNHTNAATNAGASVFFELKDSGGTIREYAGISGCKTEAGAAGGRLIFHRYARTEVGFWDADQLYSSSSVRTPIFYDSDNTGYYLNPAGSSQLSSVYANDWFRAQGNTGLYFQDKGYGITSAGAASNSYGNASTYGTGLNGWQGWGIGSRHCMMSTGGDNFGIHDNTRSWLYYWDGTYHNFQYGYLQSASSVRGPLFYDSDNTAYYCDPASTSNLNAITAAGNITAAQYYTGGWFRNNGSGNGLYNESTGQHFYSDSANYWNVASSAGAQGIRFRTGGHNGTVRGYVYANDSNDVGFLNSGGNWRARIVGGDYALFDGSSIRGQIFYDSNDTNYYCDPNGSSVLASVSARGYYPVAGVTESDIYAQSLAICAYHHGDSLTYDTFQFNAASTYETRATVGSSFVSGTVETSIFKGDRFGGMTIANNTYQARWTWNNTIGYKFLKSLYIANSTNGNSFTVTIEASGNGSTWTTIATSTAMSNWPGHSWYNYAWNNNAYQGYIRITITPSWSTAYDINIYSMRYFCSYSLDAGSRLYDWDYSKNVTFAAAVSSPIFYDSNNTAYFIDGAGTSNLLGLTVTNTITGSVSGNAATATTLQTARNINGTSFNGSANITTASWGTSRTITIGSTGKSVDGSGNVSWSLAEIGAAATNQTMFIGTTSVAINRASASLSLTGVNIDGSSGSCTGNAATATRTSGQSGYPHAGTGMFAFYNWGGSDGGTSAPSASTYTTGLSVGSNPGDQAYGFQIANNMWNTGLWTRNYNSGFGSWIRLLDSSNYVGYSAFTGNVDGTQFRDANNTAYYIDPASTSNLVGLTVANTITGAVSGNAGSVTINYNNDSNSTYQMLWGSGNNVYGTAGVYLNPSTDVLYANAFYDAGNTAYYLDPNSTSNLLLVKTRNTFGERIAVTAASSTTIDTQYNVTELTMSTNVSLTLSNIQSSGTVHMWTIVTVGNGTAYSIGWPAAIKWPGGTAPTITSTNTKRDIYQFVTYDGGTTIYAIIVGQNL